MPFEIGPNLLVFLIVLAIVLVVLAVALPGMLTAYMSYQMKSTLAATHLAVNSTAKALADQKVIDDRERVRLMDEVSQLKVLLTEERNK